MLEKNEENRQLKQNQQIQKREFAEDKDFRLGRFLEFSTADKMLANSFYINEIKNEILLD